MQSKASPCVSIGASAGVRAFGRAALLPHTDRQTDGNAHLRSFGVGPPGTRNP